MVLSIRIVLLLFMSLTLSPYAWSDENGGKPPQEGSLADVAQQMITVGPQEAREALPSLAEVDPLHVFPLLTMVRYNDQTGVSLIDDYSIFTVPKNLSRSQASELISLAYTSDGDYRGTQQFQRGLKDYILENGLHEEEAVLVYAQYEPRSDGTGWLRFVSGDSREMCGVDAASSFQMMAETNPVSSYLFDSIELRRQMLGVPE